MPKTYDEEIQKRILERKQRAARIKEEQIQRRNKILFYCGIGVVVLIVLIVIVAKISSGGSDKKKKPVETTKAVAETTTEVTTEEPTTAPIVMRTTDVLNLREQASTEAKIITQIPADKQVTIISNDGTWCYVQYGKKQGYLMAEYLTSDDNQQNTETQSTGETEQNTEESTPEAASENVSE